MLWAISCGCSTTAAWMLGSSGNPKTTQNPLLRPVVECTLFFEMNHLNKVQRELSSRSCVLQSSASLRTHELARAVQFDGFVPLSFFDECISCKHDDDHRIANIVIVSRIIIRIATKMMVATMVTMMLLVWLMTSVSLIIAWQVASCSWSRLVS